MKDPRIGLILKIVPLFRHNIQPLEPGCPRDLSVLQRDWLSLDPLVVLQCVSQDF